MARLLQVSTSGCAGQVGGTTMHSNRGTQGSTRQGRWCRRALMPACVDRWVQPGSVGTTAARNCWWSTFKHEYYYRRVFAMKSELVAAVDKWMYFYNNQRRHSVIGMLSPSPTNNHSTRPHKPNPLSAFRREPQLTYCQGVHLERQLRPTPSLSLKRLDEPPKSASRSAHHRTGAAGQRQYRLSDVASQIHRVGLDGASILGHLNGMG
jgi:hypothetical protein